MTRDEAILIIRRRLADKRREERAARLEAERWNEPPARVHHIRNAPDETSFYDHRPTRGPVVTDIRTRTSRAYAAAYVREYVGASHRYEE